MHYKRLCHISLVSLFQQPVYRSEISRSTLLLFHVFPKIILPFLLHGPMLFRFIVRARREPHGTDWLFKYLLEVNCWLIRYTLWLGLIDVPVYELTRINAISLNKRLKVSVLHIT